MCDQPVEGLGTGLHMLEKFPKILDGSCELDPALVYTVKLWYTNTPEAEGRVLYLNSDT